MPFPFCYLAKEASLTSFGVVNYRFVPLVVALFYIFYEVFRCIFLLHVEILNESRLHLWHGNVFLPLVYSVGEDQDAKFLQVRGKIF